jgi:hypothetical protein
MWWSVCRRSLRFHSQVSQQCKWVLATQLLSLGLRLTAWSGCYFWPRHCGRLLIRLLPDCPNVARTEFCKMIYHSLRQPPDSFPACASLSTEICTILLRKGSLVRCSSSRPPIRRRHALTVIRWALHIGHTNTKTWPLAEMTTPRGCQEEVHADCC